MSGAGDRALPGSAHGAAATEGDAAAARRLALAGRLRGWARAAQALTFLLGLYIAVRTLRRGGSVGGAEKTELALGALAMVIALAGLLKGRRRAPGSPA